VPSALERWKHFTKSFAPATVDLVEQHVRDLLLAPKQELEELREHFHLETPKDPKKL
jgi:hypothetical protein